MYGIGIFHSLFCAHTHTPHIRVRENKFLFSIFIVRPYSFSFHAFCSNVPRLNMYRLLQLHHQISSYTHVACSLITFIPDWLLNLKSFFFLSSMVFCCGFQSGIPLRCIQLCICRCCGYRCSILTSIHTSSRATFLDYYRQEVTASRSYQCLQIIHCFLFWTHPDWIWKFNKLYCSICFLYSYAAYYLHSKD